MEIDAEKSKVGTESEGIPVSVSNNGNIIRSPRIDIITAQATVSAADGETIILGGLITRSLQTEHRSVPWLGSIPVLKYLFSYDYTQNQRTELLIILTPHVVRSQGDIERLKQAEFARMSWCEADVFEVHGDVYPATDMRGDMMKQENWETVYPDSDPRGSTRRTAPGNPSVGPPLMNDPALPSGNTLQSLATPVEAAVYQGNTNAQKYQAYNNSQSVPVNPNATQPASYQSNAVPQYTRGGTR